MIFFYIIAAFCAAFINVALAIYILLKNFKGVVHRSFSIFGIGIAFWALALALLPITKKFFIAQIALYAGHIMVLGIILLGKTFPDQKKVGNKIWFYLIPLFSITILTPFGFFIKSINILPSGMVMPINGPLFPLLVGIVGLYLADSILSLWKRYRDLRGIARIRMRYLMLGATIFIFNMFMFDLLLPGLGLFSLNIIGPISSIAFTGFTAYAIARYRLMNIKLIIQRSILYIFAAAIVTFIFFVLYFFLQFFIHNDALDEFSDVVAAIIGAFGFSLFKDKFEQATDRIFFRKDYDYSAAVSELGPLLGSTIDLRHLTLLIREFLNRTIKTEKVVFIFKEQNDQYSFENMGSQKIREITSELMGLLQESSQQSFFIQELEDMGVASDMSRSPTASFYKKIENSLRKMGFAAVVSLSRKGDWHSAIFLGHKLSGDIFQSKDINLLEILTHHAGMAMENARLYAKMKIYNDRLEERVREKTEKIKNIYEAQSQFLIDLSHELQTPIAILEGNINILRGVGAQNSNRVLRVVRSTLDEMSRLVANMLEIGRLNFSKNKFNKGSINIAKLLIEIRQDCSILAENKGVTINVFSEKISLTGDRRKIKEVLLNLVSNALKYTDSGGEIKLIGEDAGAFGNITVSDTGVGITKEQMMYIFERFYKIKRKGIGGNGLGLNICREIIEAHGGRIVAESELGKGSKFIISLPITMNRDSE